jgi:hypothetical protein
MKDWLFFMSCSFSAVRNRTAQDVGSGRARTPAVGQQVVDLGGRMILDA